MPALSTSSQLRVSVIIPALNEAQMIGKCLEALTESEFPRDEFEVIVVDNGSTDATVDIARTFSDRLNLTILCKPGITVAALRNAGATVARGILLAFLDADCLVARRWLTRATSYFGAQNPGIVGGSVTVAPDAGWASWAWYAVGYAPRTQTVSYVPSGNMLVLRSDFKVLAGFDASLATSEDWDLCFRARRAGMVVRSVAELAVTHLRTPRTAGDFYRRERWHGRHVAKMFLKNGFALSSFRTIAFATCTVACSVMIIAGVLMGALSGSWWLAAGAMVALLASALTCALMKLRNVSGRTFWWALAPLTYLHVVYGLARGHALIAAAGVYPRSREIPQPISKAAC